MSTGAVTGAGWMGAGATGLGEVKTMTMAENMRVDGEGSARFWLDGMGWDWNIRSDDLCTTAY